MAVCAYIVAIVLLWRRRHYQPLKSRSMPMLLLSTIGNCAFFSVVMGNKILSSNYWKVWYKLDGVRKRGEFSGLNVAITTSCALSMLETWLCRPVWFIPYFFRSLRLYKIQGVQDKALRRRKDGDEEREFTTDKETLAFISETSLIKKFFLTLIPFVLIVCVVPWRPSLTVYVPFFAMP